MGDGDYVKKDCCVTMQKNKTPLQCVCSFCEDFVYMFSSYLNS